MEVTFFLSLGSSVGMSSLPRRNEGSKRIVTGSKGPSKVVDSIKIWPCLETGDQ
ncbi:hypothetical protein COLO4_34080 [Corchorus olitorius]|uniref:Uncharacterized protein n=1 Tax=Corchorus olitorius TaxID=93759 RepID=A0A1R3GNT9_9ROSI|nr:hypothetical protein COLO4_34080 [Corchorus olitorius]